MFESTRMKSPSQCQSKKAYDYLNKNHVSAISKDRFLSGSKPQVNSLSPISKQPIEYELIVQFQLRRQKQKNSILEQRLRNKQSFIKQMKQFQDGLTLAFEKSQQQLHYFKAQCQEYESKWNSFVTFNNGVVENSHLDNSLGQNIGVNSSLGSMAGHAGTLQSLPFNTINDQIVREYVQEIAELKHLVIRLEEEINYYEKRQKSMGQNGKYMSSSVKNQFFPNKGQNSRYREETEQHQMSPQKCRRMNDKKNNEKNFKPINEQKKKLRSKTLANQFVQQKKQENFNTVNKISQFITTQNRKISSFLHHFLTMCEFFDQEIEKQPSIKHKLKKAWKWVKTAIAEWNYLKKEKIQKVKEYKIGNIVSKMLPLSNLSIVEIQTLLQKIIKPKMQQQSKSYRLSY